MKRKEVITTMKKMAVCLAIPLTMSLACGSTTALAKATPKISQTTKKSKENSKKKSKSSLAKKRSKKKSKRISKIRIKGKAADNHNKLKLDSNNNLVILKGPYKDCKLKTNSKKIKLRYWGFSLANSRWEIITKKSGKAKIKVIKNGKTIKEFKVIVKKPKISAKTTKNSVNLKLENAGNRYGVTLHNVKWVFTPVSTVPDNQDNSNTTPDVTKAPDGSNTAPEVPDNSNTTTTPGTTTTESPDNSNTTIVEGNIAITLAQPVATATPSPITNRQHSAKVTIIKPGTYRVQATLLGKTYTLNKTVTVPEIDYSTRW